MSKDEMQAAVNALRQPGKLDPAIAAFQKKHGDYHLVPTHTKDEDSADWAKSFYMKSAAVQEQQGEQEVMVWGKKQVQGKMVSVPGFVSIGRGEEAAIIRAALASGEYTLVADANPDQFKFVSAIPAPYAGFKFLAGGTAASGGHSLPVRVHINVLVIRGGAIPKIKTTFPATSDY